MYFISPRYNRKNQSIVKEIFLKTNRLVLKCWYKAIKTCVQGLRVREIKIVYGGKALFDPFGGGNLGFSCEIFFGLMRLFLQRPGRGGRIKIL